MGFYLELIRTMFQAVDETGKPYNSVAAFTSSTPREGVSFVVESLTRELALETKKRVLRVDARALQTLADLVEPEHLSRHCEDTDLENLHTLCDGEPGAPLTLSQEASEWHSRPDYRRACMEALRADFDYILIDCPAISVSTDATMLAPLVDGIAIVVKAGQTRRRQIQSSQQLVADAGGKLLGFVLNQRQYPVPNWLYRRL